MAKQRATTRQNNGNPSRAAEDDFVAPGDVRWRMLMWALPLAAASSVGGLLNLSNLPAAVPQDYWIHGIIAGTFTLLSFWVLGRKRWGQSFDVLLVTLTTIAVGGRLIFALYVQGDSFPIHELLLPFSSYVPLVFVISFAMLPRWPAVLLSMSFYGVTTSGIAFYVLQNMVAINVNGQGIALLQQFVFGHAIYIAVLYVIPTIARERQRLAVERDELQRLNEEHMKRIERDTLRKIAVEAAGMGAWHIDLPGRELTWDPQTSMLFGRPEVVEAVGTVEVFLAAVDAGDRDRVRAEIETAITGSEELNTRFLVNIPGDRRQRIMRARARLLQDANAQPVRLAGLVWDITDSERMAQALQQRGEQLERSNEELEHFAYIASHDLQTPLRGISGFAQLLQMDYADKLDDKGREYIGLIVDGVLSMRALITGLLELSRAGRVDAAPEEVRLDSALQQAIERNRAEIEERGAIITHDELPVVMGHEAPLAQLFQNLLANAIKFQPDKPPQIHVSASRDGIEWRIAVRDNGIGIPVSEQRHIFDVFRRAAGTEHISGSGIGLAVCQRIVSRHGGRLWLESRVGEGTTFFFTVPAANRREGE